MVLALIIRTRVRENDGPAIADVVVKLDLSMGALSFNVWECVPDG